MLARVRFFAYQAWMLDCWSLLEDQPDERAIPRIARRCVTGARSQDELAEALNRSLNDFRATFRTDGHPEFISALRQLLRRQFVELPQDSDETELEEAVAAVIRNPDGRVTDMQDQLDPRLSETQKRLMQLAEKIGQGAFPQTICREIVDASLARCELELTEVPDTWEPAGLAETRDERWLRQGRLEACSVSCCLPVQRWYDEVHDLAQLAGVTTAEFASGLNRVRDLSDSVELLACIESLHAAARGALNLDGAPYLDLGFDDARLQIKRTNCRRPVEFGRQRLLYRLAKFLAARNEDYCQRNVLRVAWTEFGGTYDPSDNAIDNAVLRLRPLLRPLAVDIRARPPYGFRLESV